MSYLIRRHSGLAVPVFLTNVNEWYKHQQHLRRILWSFQRKPRSKYYVILCLQNRCLSKFLVQQYHQSGSNGAMCHNSFTSSLKCIRTHLFISWYFEEDGWRVVHSFFNTVSCDLNIVLNCEYNITWLNHV